MKYDKKGNSVSCQSLLNNFVISFPVVFEYLKVGCVFLLGIYATLINTCLVI